jgi:hypothetical protein
MKINVQKTERKTMFGGTRYVVSTKLELTPDEQALVQRHKVHGIFSAAELEAIRVRFGDTPYMNFLKRGGSNVSTLLAGGTLEVDSLAAADYFEAALMGALKNLKNSLIANEQSAKELGQNRSYEL